LLTPLLTEQGLVSRYGLRPRSWLFSVWLSDRFRWRHS